MNSERPVQITYFLLRVVAWPNILPSWKCHSLWLVWRHAWPAARFNRAACIPNRHRRRARVFRRNCDCAGAAYQASRVHSLWNDGGRVLAVSRTKQPLASPEPGYSSDSFLLHLPVHGGNRSRALEHRRHDSGQARRIGA
jgi:hypothetical protein